MLGDLCTCQKLCEIYTMIQYRNNSFSLRLNILALFLLTMSFTTIGCISIGPHAMKQEWLKYNNVISNIEDQQNLLNLVKLRYNDSPKMLAVTNINSQLLLGVADDSGMSYTYFEGSKLGEILISLYFRNTKTSQRLPISHYRERSL